MKKLVALLLAMGTLALFVIWIPGRDSEQQLAVVAEVGGKGFARLSSPLSPAVPLSSSPDASAKAPTQPIPVLAERRPRTFSPDLPLVTAQPPRPTAPARTATASSEHRAVVASTSELQVTNGVRTSAPTTAPHRAATQPADEASRYELARTLQRELRRVGCYWGEIDGSWGAGSKRSMAAFNERANSALPVEQPDFILLSLVQAHVGQVCGRGCPSGQAMTDSGRCIPNVVMAKRAPNRDGAVTAGNWSANTEVTPAPVDASPAPPSPLPGRMAVGGPRGGMDAASSYAPPMPPVGGAVGGPVDGEERSARSTRADPPVVIYRNARPARPTRSYATPRSASRRLTFSDVFR